MADTVNKKQINVLLSRQAESLLRALHVAKIAETGVTLSLGDVVEMLVKQEAKRMGFKPIRIRKKGASGSARRER